MFLEILGELEYEVIDYLLETFDERAYHVESICCLVLQKIFREQQNMSHPLLETPQSNAQNKIWSP